MGSISISNKGHKDNYASTTYTTVIQNWKKKEKEDVRNFNELLNKVVLDKIDIFKKEVVALFEQIYKKYETNPDKEGMNALLNELAVGLIKKAMNDHKFSQN